MKLPIIICLFILSISVAAQNVKKIDSLKRILKTRLTYEKKVGIYLKIAQEYIQLNTDSCLYYSNNGLELSKKNNLELGTFLLYRAIGDSYSNFNNWEKAFDFFIKANTVAERLQSGEGKFTKALISWDLAKVYSKLRDYPKVLELLKKSSGLIVELESNPKNVKEMLNIGEVMGIEGNIKNLTILQEIKAAIANEFGNCYLSMNKLDSAIYYYNNSIRICTEMGEKETAIFLTTNLANIYYMNKEYDKALKTYKNCFDYANEKNDTTTLYTALIQIAGIYAEQKKYDAAIRTYKEILRYSIKKRDSAFIESCYGGLKETYKKKGDYKKAILYYDSLCTIVYQTELMYNSKNISEMKIRFETSEKEKRIKLLEQENKLKGLVSEKARLQRNNLIGVFIFVFVLILLLLMYLLRRYKSERAITDEKINTLLKDQELKSVSAMMEGQEAERKRIASDLHDRLGSMLSTVKLYFGSIEEHIDKMKVQNVEQYSKATTLLDEACDEVRKISHNLVSGELVKFGLVSALNELKRTIEETGRLKIDLFTFGMENRLEGSMEITIYRIIQEMINNILKHSNAKEVSIQLNHHENNLNIVVEDDGVGFDVKIAMEKGGMGLKNIETRVQRLNGKFNIDSGRGRGTTMIVNIPVCQET